MQFLTLSKLVILTMVFNATPDDGPTVRLPKPHYHSEASDPNWLAQATQFHGHLGPWAITGLRFGAAGLAAVGAEGYFDIDVSVHGPFQRPPKACLLDGLQVATGATWGKRNINWQPADDILIEVRNTRTGAAVQLRPTDKLLRALQSLRSSSKTDAAAKAGADDHPHDRESGDAKSATATDADLEALARRLAAARQDDIIEIRPIPPARQ